MSENTKKKVICPGCGSSFEAEVAEVLTGDSPELKKLFGGTLNKVECPKCHEQFVVGEKLIFRESEPPYILYLTPAPEDGDTQELEEQMDAISTEVFMRENLPRPVTRLVFTRPDFIEKIAIRRMGMDDRIVEYAKLQLFRTIVEPQLSRSRHRLLLDYTHCDDENMAFLVFDRELLKPVNAVLVPAAEFRSLENEVQSNQDILLELESAFPGCYVSADRLL